ncbi:MAG: DUF4340 domain-containing protein [Gammaproteobacteria bacterium]|nr:DUF4340 domain-containing protein [Gammaproteobacteria bacterium]MBU1723863.1 DUF4340 domain-containing protein [Gammaproteobacteria bacterium]MBU2004497.1 DUF4340 domain-containing protein [Gammaproteobacteria bacterium]
MAGSAQSRRLFLNLAMLLLVAGLGGFVWWQANQPQQQPDTLISLTRADITRIAITRHSGNGKPDIIRLERAGEQWRMLEPVQMPANPARISQLFTLLDEAVEASYDAAGKDLQQYGLELPAVSLVLNDVSLLFGAENPVSNKRYILTGGKIRLVSEAVYGLLNGEALDLVSLKLVPEGRSVKSVSLPEGYASKAETLRNWQSADAVRLEKLEGKPDGKQQVTLALDDGSSRVFVVLPGDGDLVLANEALGIRYILPETQHSNLFPTGQ